MDVKYLLNLKTNKGTTSTQSLCLFAEDVEKIFFKDSYGLKLLTKVINEDSKFKFSSDMSIDFLTQNRTISMVIQGVEEWLQNGWETTPRDLDLVLGVLDNQTRKIKKFMDPVEKCKVLLLCNMLGVKRLIQ